MRAVLQRVSRAKVTVEGRVTGEIGAGLMILLGVGREDSSAIAASMAEKCANLRIFEDEQGKMNRSLLEVKGGALVVSQFTLYGDARGQERPREIAAVDEGGRLTRAQGSCRSACARENGVLWRACAEGAWYFRARITS